MKKDILFITANNGYIFDGIIGDGYAVQHPYFFNNILGRIIREIFFRIPFLPKTIFYNKKYLEADFKYLFIYDALITKHYLNWILKKRPDVKVFFYYGNLVGKARHINPIDIPKSIRIWTYDYNDAVHYKINYMSLYAYHTCYVPKESFPVEYDLLFVGKDKGRGDSLIKFTSKLSSLGIRHNFIITKDGRFSKNKPYYSSYIDYSELVKMISKSKAILNVGMPNQHGVTVRDAESLFFNKKLVTTVNWIKQTDLYNDSNVLVIDDFSDKSANLIYDFLNKKNISMEEIKSKHTFDVFVSTIIKES